MTETNSSNPILEWVNNDSPILEWKDAKPEDEALARKASKKLQLGKLYFAYNVPLQIWINYKEDDDPGSGIDLSESNILNYMPRKERCEFLNLDEVFSTSEDITAEDIKEFAKVSALILRNLAARMERLDPLGKNHIVYYPNDSEC